MLQRFYPDEYLDSTYVIDFDKLYEEGYRGIILILIIHLFHTEHRRMSGQKAVCSFKRAGLSLYAVIE